MAKFDAFGMVVSDMEATLSFYRLLGLDIEAGPGAPHVEATLPGGIRIMWDTVEVISSFSEWEQPGGSARVALAFRCDSAGDVDAQHAALVAAGHRSLTEPFDAPWGQRYATVLDPDGNPIDLYAPQ